MSTSPSTKSPGSSANLNVPAQLVLVPENLEIKYQAPYLLAFLLIFLLFGIFFAIQSVMSIADIKKQWPTIRCKPYIMPIAGLFGYDVNENFNFCIQQIVAKSAAGVTAPFAQGMGGFTDVLGNLMNSANSIRTTLATLTGGIIKLVSEFKNRMTALMGRIKLSASRMKVLMSRVYGTMFAVLYMGMSATTAVTNFADGTIANFFCFAKDTQVAMHDGSYSAIQNIVTGSKLSGGAVVEAVIETPGPTEPLFSLYGVSVSGSHRVFCDESKAFVYVKDHPHAKQQAYIDPILCNTLWTLITSTREIPVKGNLSKPIRFADWKELPAGNIGDAIWNEIADSILNGVAEKPAKERKVPLYGACLDKDILVFKYQGGHVPLSSIIIGDYIKSGLEWTRVIGRCEREVSGGIGRHGVRLSDGLWMKPFMEKTDWSHPMGNPDRIRWKGIQLVTESGSFNISINGSIYDVMDFTEVGHSRISLWMEKEDAARSRLESDAAAPPLGDNTMGPIE